MAYIPSIKRNMISVPILDILGYSFLFGTIKVELYRDSLLIGTRLLSKGLYILELSSLSSISATLTVNTTSSSKRLRLKEKSSTLWHKHLGHIYRHIIERLIKDGILPNLEFSYFNTSVDYIKGKLTTKVRNAKVDI